MSDGTLQLPGTVRPTLSSRARLQWDPVRQKQVILMPERVLVLNATAAAILVLCDGQHTLSTISAELSARYGQAVDQDVLALLDRLAAKHLLEFPDG